MISLYCQRDLTLLLRLLKIVNGIAGVTWKFAIHCEYVLGIRAADLVKLQMDEELYRARVRQAATRKGT